MTKKLYKSRRDVKLDGVCGGIAEYMGLDSTLVRLIWALFVVFGGSGIFLYIICAVLMPREPEYVIEDYRDMRQDSHEN